MRLGDYELIERIGEGGMGEVWRAENAHTHVAYAVKLLPVAATSDPGFVKRFFDEGRLMAELEHPGIVRVHHVGHDQTSGRYYLVMDLVRDAQGRSTSLHDTLADAPDGRLPETRVRELALQIAEALAFAHGKGVVHRDIKPANVMIDAAGHARLTDFGLAKALGGEFMRTQIHQSIHASMSSRSVNSMRTARRPARVSKSIGDEETDDHGSSSESLIGTYDYMSPEARGELPGVEVGTRSDVYSLGVMLYRLLTGRRPVGMAEAPSELVKGLSKSWDGLVARCLKHDPQARFADGRELFSALRTGRASRNGAKAPVGRGAKGLMVAAVLAAVAWAGWEYGWKPYLAEPAPPPEPTPLATPVVPDPAAIGTLLVGARAALDGGEVLRALEIVGQAAALDASNPDVADLRERIRAALQKPSVPGAPPKPAAADTAVAFRLAIKPAGAAVTLTHDARGLVVETNVPADGVELKIAPDTYHALVTAPGFRSVQQDVDVPAGGGAWALSLSERRGELTVRAAPGAEIAIAGADGVGRSLGLTDAKGVLSVTTLREGDYEVRASLIDHASITGRVSLVEGKPQELKIAPPPLPGRLKIGGREGLEIWRGGAFLGMANAWVPLPAGDHALELRCAGFRTESMAVTIPPNRDVVKQSPDLVAESGAVRIVVTVPPYAAALFQALEKRIKIGSNPWKTVRDLPHVESGLPCASADVEVAVSGFDVSGAPRSVATVADGQTGDVAFALSPLPARLTLTCNVTGATVQVGTGAAPVRLTSEPIYVPALRPIQLTVAAPGHTSQTVTFGALDPDAGHTNSVALESQHFPDLRVPWENSLGMKFVPVPGTEVLFCVWETRNRDYRVFKLDHDSGSYEGETLNGDLQPVVNISWDDAKAFCAWLTEKERRIGRISSDRSYRLPADWEWTVAVGLREAKGSSPKDKDAKTPDVYPWGNQWPPPQGAENYADETAKRAISGFAPIIEGYDDGFAATAPAGSFAKNHFGLYDMGGNVWEWCENWYDPSSMLCRVSRGASWGHYDRGDLLSSCRFRGPCGHRSIGGGVRVVLSPTSRANDSSESVERLRSASDNSAIMEDRLGSQTPEDTAAKVGGTLPQGPTIPACFGDIGTGMHQSADGERHGAVADSMGEGSNGMVANTERGQSKLTIEATPRTAKVTCNGRLLLAFSAELDPGVCRLRAECPGYASVETNLMLLSGETVIWRFSMDKKRGFDIFPPAP